MNLRSVQAIKQADEFRLHRETQVAQAAQRDLVSNKKRRSKEKKTETAKTATTNWGEEKLPTGREEWNKTATECSADVNV